MPRRQRTDALSEAIGARIRQLRQEAGLTLEKLAYESELGSKGHLSNIERGRVHATAHTLKVIADRLGLLPLDILTFPENDVRQELIDQTRTLPRDVIRRLLKELRGSRRRAAAVATATPTVRDARRRRPR